MAASGSGINKCPSMAITGFPLSITGTITQDDYDSVNEPVTCSFSWATRSTQPTFMADKNLLDEGTNSVGGFFSGSSTTNTVVFDNTTYNLYSVQLASTASKGTHNDWLLANKASNKEDVIFTFQSTFSKSTYQYFMLVIPIIRTGTTAPSYINSLIATSGTMPPNPVSLKDLLPLDNRSQFAYYSTCLEGYSDLANSSDIVVFVSLSGINVAESTMSVMSSRIKAIEVPFQTGLKAIKTSITTTELPKYVATTTWLLNPGGFKGRNPKAVAIRKDDLSKYKCTQLNPERDVQNGQLQIDLSTGNLLSDIMQERRDLIEDATGVSQTAKILTDDDKKYSQSVTNALGIMMGIIFSLIIIFLIVSGIQGAFGYTAEEQAAAGVARVGAAGAAVAGRVGAARVVGAAGAAAGAAVAGAARGAALSIGEAWGGLELQNKVAIGLLFACAIIAAIVVGSLAATGKLKK